MMEVTKSLSKIRMLKVADLLTGVLDASWTVTVKEVNDSFAVGVPEIRPVAVLMDKPFVRAGDTEYV